MSGPSPQVGTKVEVDQFNYWGLKKDLSPVFNKSKHSDNRRIGDSFTSLMQSLCFPMCNSNFCVGKWSLKKDREFEIPMSVFEPC